MLNDLLYLRLVGALLHGNNHEEQLLASSSYLPALASS
jgi:hypothetical protein